MTPVTRRERTSGPEPTVSGLLAVAPVQAVAHPRTMSATPIVERRGYPAGVALYCGLVTLGLLALAWAIVLVVVTVERDALPGLILFGVAAIPAAVGICVLGGIGIYYQAWPVPRPLVGASLTWRPPLVVRAILLVVCLSITAMYIAIATMHPGAIFLLLSGLLALSVWPIAGRGLVARLEADGWGIRCTSPTTTLRIPWEELRSLEPRGESARAQRIVAVTKQGRERMLWVFDLRVPVSRDAAQVLVAELEAVRRLAATPNA